MAEDRKVSRFPAAAGHEQPDAPALPPGKLEMVVTYLEMRAPPPAPAQARRAERISVLRARRITVSFYRYLYETVGGPWMWYERREMDDRALAAVVQDPMVAVYVLYLDGVPAGFVELDRRTVDQVEVAYFGLLPEFIGRGLGRYFLGWAVGKAWESEPERVWVHTCNFDHPGALGAYQRSGFQVYDQQRSIIDDPRRS